MKLALQLDTQRPFPHLQVRSQLVSRGLHPQPRSLWA
jgi:hypothetical protein